MKLRHIVSLGLAITATATLVSQSSAEATKFPFDVEVVKSIGFRKTPGLKEDFVEAHKYLPEGADVTITGVVSATGGAATLWTDGAYCQAEHKGHKGYIRCDATGRDSTKVIPAGTYRYTNAYGETCAGGGDKMESCTKFCSAVCDVVPGKTTLCPRMPIGKGMIAATSPDLKPLPRMTNVHDRGADTCKEGVCHTMRSACTTNADCIVRATDDVIKGLQALDQIITKEYPGYSVKVSNCWRDPIHTNADECRKVLKGKGPGIAAWPGADPHSTGHACDMYLYKNGHEVVHHGDHDAAKNVCTDQEGARAESGKFDEMLKKAGAWRLLYEPWHFEWGMKTTSCRCQAPTCNDDKHWPPKCSSSQCSD